MRNSEEFKTILRAIEIAYRDTVTVVKDLHNQNAEMILVGNLFVDITDDSYIQIFEDIARAVANRQYLKDVQCLNDIKFFKDWHLGDYSEFLDQWCIYEI